LDASIDPGSKCQLCQRFSSVWFTLLW
jgi:hypothetical protein